MFHRPTLNTSRLVLRPFRLDDAPAVFEHVRAREIADTTLSIPHPYEPGMAEKWIETHKGGYDKGESVHFAIVLRDDKELVGAISLIFNPDHSRAEMGYWIGLLFWGRGYCTEAVGAVLEYGFEERGLNRIFATHFKRNPASGRVMQKNGMLYEGCLRQHLRKWDAYEDLVFYSLLRDEWQAQAAGEMRFP